MMEVVLAAKQVVGHRSGVRMARPNHVVSGSDGRYWRPTNPPPRGALDMQYLPLFLLFMAVLIAAYFYLERAKKRDAGKNASATTNATTSTPSAADLPE
jgi:hypothetical protein